MESDVCLEDRYPEPLLAVASYGLPASNRMLPTQTAVGGGLACGAELRRAAID